jgi:hypothetical protein
MAMISKLKEAKDSQYDLTAMPNAFDMTTHIGNDNLGSDPKHHWSLGDRVGVLLGLNGRKLFTAYFLSMFGLA